MKYMEASALTGENVEDVFYSLAEDIKRRQEQEMVCKMKCIIMAWSIDIFHIFSVVLTGVHYNKSIDHMPVNNNNTLFISCGWNAVSEVTSSKNLQPKKFENQVWKKRQYFKNVWQKKKKHPTFVLCMRYLESAPFLS